MLGGEQAFARVAVPDSASELQHVLRLLLEQRAPTLGTRERRWWRLRYGCGHVGRARERAPGMDGNRPRALGEHSDQQRRKLVQAGHELRPREALSARRHAREVGLVG